MSHHYSGPDYGFPHGDARLDLTDLYAFPTPGEVGKSILIMNVHPAVGVSPPEPTTDEPFAAEAVYEICIDTDGDAVADVAYRVRFSLSEGGTQSATLRRADGARTLIEQAPVSTGRDSRVTASGEYRLFAGWRSDPFFFDTLGALDDMKFTGTDFFTGKDVCSIVIEVPNAALGDRKVGLWARTVDGAGGKWVQAERGARPSQSVFLSGDQKAAYMAASPAEDARFVAVYAHSLEHTGGYSPDAARRVAATLLPDILFYDPREPACFPHNGRALRDDVMDGFIAILDGLRALLEGGAKPGRYSNQVGELTESIAAHFKVKTDNVAAHEDLLDVFPYVGPPHKDR